MRMLVAVALGMAMVAGGAEAQSLRYRAAPEAVVAYNRPPLDEEAVAEPGQVVLEAGGANPAIVVTKGGKARLNGNRAELHEGLYRLVARSDGGAFYQPDRPMTLSAFGLGGTWPEGGLYVPDEPSAGLRVYMRNGLGMVLHSAIEGIAYEPAPPQAVPGGFRRELVYGGSSKGVISLTYREFVGDMARPAFTQALTYDLADGDEIAYQGARIKVLSAGNVGLKYKVLAALKPR